MKQSPIPRYTPLVAKAPLKRRTELGSRPGDPDRVPLRRRRNTGPSKETADMVRDRDLGCCVRCGRPEGRLPLNAHHRKRRSQGGKNDLDNLIMLCGSGSMGCHGYVHSHVTESEDNGWLVRSNADPARKRVRYMTPRGPAWQYLTEDGFRSEAHPDGVSAA